MSDREDNDAVLHANRAFYAAFERLDLDAMGRLWSSTAPLTCVHPRGQFIEGRDAVMRSFGDIFRATRGIEFKLIGVRAFVVNDAAWVLLIEQMEASYGERTVRAETQSTNIFVREADGWKMVHHHAEPATARRAESPKPAPSKANLN